MIVRSNAHVFRVPRSLAVALGLGLAGLTSGLAATPAKAQFVCEMTTGGGDGAVAMGGNNPVACGTAASATGAGSTAVGPYSDASGQASTAVGFNAEASAQSSTALGEGAVASGEQATAIGAVTTASGKQATAVGGSTATGNYSSAFGTAANASGESSLALGAYAAASANGTIAIGSGAQAGFGESIAIGRGVSTTRANQISIGNATHTYTFAGVTSAASTAAQTGPVSVVTTDANGNLAAVDLASLGLGGGADLSGINSRLDEHDRKISKNTEGVAIALAMAGVPTLTSTEKFAMSANWGTFEGENGFAGGAAVRLDSNVQINGGIGFGSDTVGGRAGVRIGW